MRAYSTPGVYPVLIDNSTQVQGTSGTIAAFVGAAPFGPVNTITPITSPTQYINLFGLPNASYGFMGYCALCALEECSLIYVTRVVSDNSKVSSVKINNTESENPTQVSGGFTLTQLEGTLFSSDTNSAFLCVSQNPGLWGNNILISTSNINQDLKTFSISVYESVSGVNTLVEQWDNLSRDPSSIDGYNISSYYVNVINGNSTYIYIYDNTSVSSDLLPKEVTLIQLTGALDGDIPNDSTISQGWTLYQNSDDVSIDYLVNSGYCSSSSILTQTMMQSIALSRRDCRALLDIPYSELSMSPTTKATNWRNSVQNFGSYFTSLDASWITIQDGLNGGIQLDIPFSGFTAQIMARANLLKSPWSAPAGTQLSGNIGVITSSYFSIIGLTKSYPQAIQGLLYNANINYCRSIPGVGITRWGQKTQQLKASALNRENVAILSILIERSCYIYLQNAVFELNDSFTRNEVFSALDNFMSNILAQGGVYTYQVICDLTNNTPQVINANQLAVTVSYQPVRSAEFIVLTSTVNPNGGGVSITSSANG